MVRQPGAPGESGPPQERTREANAGDYPRLARLFDELGVPQSPPRLAQWDYAHTLVFEADGAAIGYVLADEPAAGDAYVHHLVVAPSGRGRGVGERLMRALAANLVVAGCSTWHLHLRQENAAARRLYERLGMRETATSTGMYLARASVAGLPGPAREFVDKQLAEGRMSGEPGAGEVVVVVEGDAKLLATLLAAGATVTLELARLDGALPLA